MTNQNNTNTRLTSQHRQQFEESIQVTTQTKIDELLFDLENQSKSVQKNNKKSIGKSLLYIPLLRGRGLD